MAACPARARPARCGSSALAPSCGRGPGVPPALGARPRPGVRPWRPRRPAPAPPSPCLGLGRPAMARSRPPFPGVHPPQPPYVACSARSVRRPRPARSRRGLGGARAAPARRPPPPVSPPRRGLAWARCARSPGAARAAHGAAGELAAPAARCRGARPGVPDSPASARRAPPPLPLSDAWPAATALVVPARGPVPHPWHARLAPFRPRRARPVRRGVLHAPSASARPRRLAPPLRSAAPARRGFGLRGRGAPA
jgi:hypothetical protein